MAGTTYALSAIEDKSLVQSPASSTNSPPLRVYRGGRSVLLFDSKCTPFSEFEIPRLDPLQVSKDAPRWTAIGHFNAGLVFAKTVTSDDPSRLEESQTFLQHIRQVTDEVAEKEFPTPSDNALANGKRRLEERPQSRSTRTLSCHDVAQYLLAQMDVDAGDLISNLKLQKLVYYAQGFALALYSRPLFSERIEAWTHGPVVPDLYHEYKGFGSEALPFPSGYDFSNFDAQTRALLDEVYATYGQFSAWKLRDMTHSEPPWCDTPVGHEIRHDGLSDYFVTRTARDWETE